MQKIYVSSHEHQTRPNPALAAVHGQAALLLRYDVPNYYVRDESRFSSAILPKYMRRAPSVDALIPALYLKGISTGDFKRWQRFWGKEPAGYQLPIS